MDQLKKKSYVIQTVTFFCLNTRILTQNYNTRLYHQVDKKLQLFFAEVKELPLVFSNTPNETNLA